VGGARGEGRRREKRRSERRRRKYHDAVEDVRKPTLCYDESNNILISNA